MSEYAVTGVLDHHVTHRQTIRQDACLQRQQNLTKGQHAAILPASMTTSEPTSRSAIVSMAEASDCCGVAV
jgi:hypothetical protein